MWKVLLSIAKGYATAYSAMMTFFSGLSWDDIASVSDEDQTFFRTGKILSPPCLLHL